MRKLPKPRIAVYPLARRMVVVVILWSILFTFVTTGVQVYLDYHREMDLLNARLQQIRVIEVPSLANSIWQFDKKQIETQLLGILNFQDIHYVKLQIVGGDTYKAGEIVPDTDSIIQVTELDYTQSGETFPIGRLQVVADKRSLQQRVVSRLSIILLTAAIQIFLLAGFILLVVEWLLTRPLNDIVRYAETLDLEHLEEPLMLQHRRLAPPGDELDMLVLKLNEMRRRLIDDISERQRMDSALRESERSYREVFNTTYEAIFILEVSSSRILQVNASMLRIYGYAIEDEVIGSLFNDLSSNETPYTQTELERYRQKASTEGPQIFEWLARKKSGETLWVEVSLRNSTIGGENRILAVVRDITDRKQSEEQIRTALREKETLLRELYHRTKNNMQVISSLLSLQSSYTQNEEVKTVFAEMGNRIQAMAMVHQKLYQAHDLSRIDLKEYITDLVHLILASTPHPIGLRLDLAPAQVSIDTAMPFGLILSELMSNALKHAFPNGRQGEISIYLKQPSKNRLELRFCDDGVGLPPNFKLPSKKSLGLQNLFTLAENQLQGTVKYTNAPGLCITVRFPIEKDATRL